MSVTLTKYTSFRDHLGQGVHDLGNDTFKMALSNTTPDLLNNLVYTDINEIAGTNGYTTGGNTCSSLGSFGGGVWYLSNPATWTASGGAIATFRYAILYNSTKSIVIPRSGHPLIGYYDASTVSLSVGQTFNVVFDAVNGIIAIT